MSTKFNTGDIFYQDLNHNTTFVLKVVSRSNFKNEVMYVEARVPSSLIKGRQVDVITFTTHPQSTGKSTFEEWIEKPSVVRYRTKVTLKQLER